MLMKSGEAWEAKDLLEKYGLDAYVFEHPYELKTYYIMAHEFHQHGMTEHKVTSFAAAKLLARRVFTDWEK